MGIVDVALSQVGVKESGVNSVKYNDWFYGKHVSGSKYPWCAVFVSWCADQAGVSRSIVPKEAAVSGLMDFFKRKGWWQPKGNGYKPKAGDIMIQKSNGASHTGIVTGCSGNTFHTVEGNTSNCVGKRSYSLNHASLTGFGTPKYTDSPGGSSGNSGGNSEKPSTGGNKLDPVTSSSNSGGWYDLVTESGRNTIQIEVSHPTIEAIFYTETAALAAVSTTGLNSSTDVDNDIISVNTMRNMSQDCPTMNISLVWRRGWYKALSSNDLVIIKMQRPPEPKAEVFFGLVDDIRKTMDFSSGQPQRAVQVTCRGLAKAFVNFDVGLIENISIQPETGFFSQLTSMCGIDSYDAIQMVWNAYVGKGVNYKFNNGKSLQDYLKYSGTHRGNEKLLDYTSYTSYNGSLWNFIKEISNLPFNETFWEIVNGKPNMIHRKTPFNKAEWTQLPRIEIEDADIVSDNTGRSDLETYVVYQVNPVMLGADTKNVYFPLWYRPYYDKYGITMLSVDSVYMGIS